MTTKTVRIVANDVDVGTLPIHQYNAFRTEAQRDRRLYFAQSMNCANVTLRLLVRIIYATPIAWFWLLAAQALCDKPGFAKTFSAIGNDSADMANALAQSILGAAIFTTISACMAVCFSGRPFGFINVFDLAINKKIRKALKLPVDADLTVIPDATSNEDDREAAISRMRARPTTCTTEVLGAFNDPSLPEISGNLPAARKRFFGRLTQKEKK